MPLRYVICFVIVFTGLFANFFMPKKVIDKIQMITAVGYDYIDENTIQGTVVTPYFLPENKIEDLLYTDKSSMVYENRVKLNAKAANRLYNGKMEVALFNRKLAENGLDPYFDFVVRDPSIGSNIYFAVVEGSALTFLKTLKAQRGKGLHLSNLIDHNILDGTLPKTNRKLFISKLESELADPFLPLLDIKGDMAEVTGIALFKGLKVVDSIPLEELFTFKMLDENMKNAQYNYKADNYKASVENIQSTRNYKVEKKKDEVTVKVHITFLGTIREYTGENIADHIDKFEKDLEKSFKQNAEKMLSRFQELNIDPLGIKAHMKSGVRGYAKEQVKKDYLATPIDVTIQFKLIEHGIKR